MTGVLYGGVQEFWLRKNIIITTLMIDKSTPLCTDQNIKILFLVYNPFLRVGCSQGGWLATQSTPSGSAPAQSTNFHVPLSKYSGSQVE